jgi:hypothetical protein
MRDIMRTFRRGLWLLAVPALASCATVLAGTTQNVVIDSDPPQATCRVTRGGVLLFDRLTTPQKINVPRHKESLELNCTAVGMADKRQFVAAGFSGGTMGNIFMGGLIGAAVDAGSGANNAYPDHIIVVMAPASFADAAARDTWFVQTRARLEVNGKAAIDKARRGCSTSNTELCAVDVKRETLARDQALAELDRMKGTLAPAPPAAPANVKR